MAEIIDLARKYRSKNMVEYVGNKEVKDSVSSIRKKEKKPQVIMLFGNSGCGKTTAARIIATEYMCENPTIDGACGECGNCLEMQHFIETGEDVLDVHEIDLTSKATSSKDAMENLLTEAEQPTLYKYKIYIFDECHMAPPTAQNRMLKILEEPPEHLVFILCTTEPNKMLNTLHNRCRYKLKVSKPTSKELCDRLRVVCNSENIEYSQAALRAIVKVSKSVPRQALNDIERLVNEKGCVDEAGVAEVFGVMKTQWYFDFLTAVLKKREDRFIRLFVELVTNGKDLDLFLTELLEFVSLGIYIRYNARVDEITPEELKAYKELFEQFEISELLYISEVLILAKNTKNVLEDDYTLSIFIMNKLIYNKKNTEVTEEKQPLVVADTVEKTRETFMKTKRFQEIKEKFDNQKQVPLGFKEVADIFND